MESSSENKKKESIANGNGTIKPLETSEEEKERYKSLYIIYFTLFLQSLGLAVCMTGIWPYVSKLDPGTTKEFYSLIVAANPLGQFIFSPLIGLWQNKSASIRWPIITSLIIFIISNAFYSSLDMLVGYGVKYWMLIIRFFTGVASANIAVGRGYISAATKVEERTHVLSMASLSQVGGFIAGPLLQAVFTAIGEGYVLSSGYHISMYTVPGLINTILGAINIFFFLPHIFVDHNIAVREQMALQGKESAKETYKSVKIDYLVTCALIFSYFIVCVNLVLLESLGTPLTMDQFGFSRKDTLKWNGILVGIGAFVSCVIFCLLPRLSKILKEIDILIWGGMFIAVIGKIIYIPYRGDPPPIADENFNSTIFLNNDNSTEILGCPVKTQSWCATTSHALGIPEFVIGYFFGVIGYPVGVTLIQTLFSKILGARPQGTWMGIMLAAGSMSRIVGPIVIVASYTEFGLGYTFAWITIFMCIPMILLYSLRNRLITDTPKADNINMTDVKSQTA
ncbi:hypothetical protein PVAND_007374 [Polypedilum vanderplanki]|uniref:Uncharacterized protein n=1 Tax=Polypedilum vanderplanki TaxID=319348 RepID=A0A9J6C6B7_POLVA|nr:hypothetical protein PVAND_007374 [Polypedilum vanderplanki]